MRAEAARPRRKRILVSLVTFLVLILLVEGGARLMLGGNQKISDLRTFLRDGHSRFSPHPFTGFVLQDFGDATDTTRPVDWAFDREKRPGVPRIACLGGSTTAGGYPRFMKEKLERETGREFDVMNWGVHGWSTIESMINYFINVQDYDPDVVIIHHALNDTAARRRDGYRNDYAHWRRPWSQVEAGFVTRWLILSSDLYAAAFIRRTRAGVKLKDFVDHPFRGLSSNASPQELPAGTAQGFVRNIRTITEHVENRGGLVVLFTMPYQPEESGRTLWEASVQEHNQFLRDLAEERGYLLIDGERYFEERSDELLPLFIDRVHLAHEGRVLKAALVVEGLLQDGRLMRIAGAAGEE